MTASEFLDSKSRDEILKRFIATYRNKRKKPGELEAALQAVFNAAGVTEIKKEIDKQFPLPVPEPSPQADAPKPLIGDMNDLEAAERARIFDLDMPPVPKPTAEQKAAAHAEARAGRLAQLKQFLPANIPLGRKASVVLPDDFPVQDLPGYLAEVGGYGVTDKVPENIGMSWRVKSKQAELNGQQYTGPKSGWQVELIKLVA